MYIEINYLIIYVNQFIEKIPPFFKRCDVNTEKIFYICALQYPIFSSQQCVSAISL